MVPERIAGAPSDLVVRDDEVAHVLEFEPRLPIIFVDVGRGETGRREQRQQLVDAGLDQMDAGRFQRLEEAGRRPDRNDVLLPRLQAPARPEADRPRIGQRFTVEVRRAGFPPPPRR